MAVVQTAARNGGIAAFGLFETCCLGVHARCPGWTLMARTYKNAGQMELTS